MAAKATNTALKETKITDLKKTAGPGRKKKKTAGRNRGGNSGRMERMGAIRSSGKKAKQTGSKAGKEEKMSVARQGKGDGAGLQEGIPMGNEVTLVVSAGLMILMMLSNFGLCGWVGEILSSLFFGVFGFAQYAMPIVFFVIVLMLVANDYSLLSIKKSGSLFGIMLVISGYSQLFCAPEGYMADEIFGDAGTNHFLGGVIAGGIAEFLRGGFGMAGALIILTCLLILLLVMLTQKSAITFFKEVYSRVRAFASDRKEKAEVRSRNRKKKARKEEEISMESGLLELEEEEWAFPDEPLADEKAQALHSNRVEDKVRAIEDEIHQTRKKGNTGSKTSSSKVDVPVFVESDEVHVKDSLKELHAGPVPFDDKDGKTDPFEGDLDYSAFLTSQKESPELTDQVMRALRGEENTGSGGSRSSRGSGLGSSIEEIRIHHGDGEAVMDDIDLDMEEVDQALEEKDLPGTEDGLVEKEGDPAGTEKEFPYVEIMEAEEDSFHREEDSFHIVDEAPETGEMDPRKAMRMSQTPVTSQEKKTGRAMPAVDSEEAVPVRNSNRKSPAGTSDKTKTRAKKADDLPMSQPMPAPKQAGAEYVFPPMTLLTKDESGKEADLDEDLKETALKLQQTLHSFGVNVKITDISCGPSVTRYELFPEQGVKVSKIVSLTDDIKLNLAAADVRIEAPIPGKAAIGIEVPNKKVQMVHFRDLIDNRTFRNMKSRLSFAAGKDIGGKIVMADLAKMPHMLVAGTTGSGKSVFINTIIMSILYKASPDQVRLIMVDPKMVELSVYNGIPHLLIPVVTDPKKASSALSWAVAEMTERYRKFAETGTRNLSGYNKKVDMLIKSGEVEEGKLDKLPQIVIIIDELADLMMVAKSEVEDAIVRLSQLARAAGIHMVIATQRPSVDVITGLIKANVPSRVALSVSSGTDSRTILDMNGAEKLLGNGDMLFYPSGYQKPVRVQGAYISDEDILKVTDFLRANAKVASYDASVSEKIEKKISVSEGDQDRDEYFEAAARFIMEKDKATIGMLQRMFKIGFNRAARIIDQLAEAGIVGPEEGTKPRKILMSPEELDAFFEEGR